MAKVFSVDSGGTLLTGLVSYYKCSSPYDYYSTKNLTDNGGVSFSAGKVSYGADFGTGANKSLRILDNLGITNGSISMSGWFNISTAPTSGNLITLMSHTDAGVDINNIVYYWNVAGTLKVVARRTRSCIADYDVATTQTLTTGTWYHITYTYNSSTGDINLYINASAGSPTTANTGNGNNDANNTTGFAIGEFMYSGSPRYLTGKADEVGVWSKVLSSTEVTDLYNAGNGQSMTQTTVKKFLPDTDATLVDNLISYYKLEDANDYYASNNLTAVGGTSYVAAKINNGASLDGTGDYLKGGDVMDRDQTDSWSVSCWVKRGETSTSGGLVTKYDEANDKGWAICLTSGNELRIMMNSSATNGYQRKTASIGTDTASYHHVVATYNGSTKAQTIWFDGVSKSLTDENTNLSASTTNAIEFNIGAFNNGAFADINAIIDEVGVWGKVLSATEIADLYNSGNGQTMVDVQNLTLTTAVTNYTLTGQNAVLSWGRRLTTAVTNYVLTMKDAIFTRTGWISETKHTTEWTDETAHSTSWSDETKNATIWTDETKH